MRTAKDKGEANSEENRDGRHARSARLQYLRATIPKGKWSISLGAQSEENCAVDLSSYNERGVDYPTSFSIISVGKEERKEKIITLAKPTTLIFRVLNDSQADNVAYDVTIEPSTD